MDLETLILCIALVLAIFSGAYAGASNALRGQTYWRTWTLANVMLAAAFTFQLFVPAVGEIWQQIPVQVLALAGLVLCLRGARQFNGVEDKTHWYALPFAALGAGVVLTAITGISPLYRIAFDLVVIVIAVAAIGEYGFKQSSPFAPRIGLVASFSLLIIIMALLAANHLLAEILQVEWAQGFLAFDVLIMLELVFVTANGAFCLSLAFERKLQEEREAAIRDPLTGAYNRREFMARLERALTSNAEPFALLVLDVDHFKAINDTHGHDCGDEALKSCVETMRSTLRPQDCLARLGGEEFAILMPSIKPSRAANIAETIRETISAREFNLCGVPVRMTLSAGLFAATAKGLTPKAVLKAADKALYVSKGAGRNQISLADAV